MTNKHRIHIAMLIISFIMVMSFLFYGTSQLLAFFKSGASRADMLLLASETVNDYYQPAIRWIHTSNEGRPMEDGTLQKITRDYLASYYYLYQSFKTGNATGLYDHFTEKPREYLLELVNHMKDRSQTLEGTTVTHTSKLQFYSEDGTIVTFQDKIISYEHSKIQDSSISRNYDTSVYSVMMLLEDNFWRIRHKILQEEEQKPPLSLEKPSYRNKLDSFRIKGINYYPQSNPWEDMWLNFDSTLVKKDLDLIKSLNFNTIRIFIPYDLFGRAQPPKEHLRSLMVLMNLAQKADLKVIVTLFDFFLGYRVEEWTIADRHAEHVIQLINGHPALLAYDIKNEPDLDFNQAGKENVLAWLEFMAARIRAYDPEHMITVGWSQPEFVHLLQEDLDLLSFHFYRDPLKLQSWLDTARYEKPLFLGETGHHTFSRWWFPLGQDEEDQLSYYQDITDICGTHGVDYAIWTLYDFKHIPANVVGKLPWRKGPQKAYGFIDLEGKAKPSFKFFQQLNSKN